LLGRFISPDSYNIIFEKEKGKDDKEQHKLFLSYISQPQVWNKYNYTLNNPLLFTDPDGRREINAQDQARLNIVNKEAYEAFQRGDFGRADVLYGAAAALANAIADAPDDPSKDPANLKAAFWAIDQLGNTRYAQAGSHDNTFTVAAGPNTNKCNIFVFEAYSFGANLGFSGRGVPTNFSIRHPLTYGNFYTANNLADATVQISNFSVRQTGGGSQIGDIVSFANPNQNQSGHTGIAIGNSVIIHAASDRVKVDSFSDLKNKLTTQWGGNARDWTMRVYKP